MGNSSDLNPPKCGCLNPKPCSCNPPRPCSKCTGDRRNNMWVERACQPDNDDVPGICLLDTMTKSQIIYTLEHNPRAARDLLKITTDPDLIYLAQNVGLLPTPELVDMEQSVGNRNYRPESYPFYGIFAGRPPFAQPTGNNLTDDSGPPGPAVPFPDTDDTDGDDNG